VIGFGHFVAVPFCGKLLAEGGAEVIKVESPEGDPNRHMAEVAPFESRIFISRNRGKRSLPLKLSDASAKQVIDAMVSSADVVLMNLRPGLTEKLGIDAASLTSRFPRLIVGEITPFGKQGPDASLAGMDIVVQARSGLMAAMGRIEDERPVPGEPVISDYMAATSLAFGISSALLRRERTGKGGIVDVSLMQSALTLANNQMTRHEDLDRDRHLANIETLNQQRLDGVSFREQMENMPSSRLFTIRAIYFRTYATLDGTIAVACVSRRLQTGFAEALGFSDDSHRKTVDDTYIRALQAEVEAMIRARSSDYWLDLLKTAGCPVSTVKFPVEMFEDPQAEANSMFEIVTHPTAGRFRVLSPPVKLDGDGFQTQPPTLPFGSETYALLQEFGIADQDIQELIETGVTVQADVILSK
jgi:crotonobetainyl-CoA:carnitine CoA-transferase CaiB-like acyl-CoA transferase